MLGEEFFHASIEIDLVFGAGETMPFVGGSKFINATRKEIGPHFQRAQCGVAAHRPTHRRDPFWISDPLIHGPTHCIKKVFHHPKPNLKIASIEELDAETD